MVLYIIRHGKAKRESPSGYDGDRELRDRGVNQAMWLGEQLAESDAAPTLVVTSPLVRAHHTARLIADAIDCPLEIDDALSGGVDTAGPTALIEEHLGSTPVLALVGHNPQLELLTWSLLEDDEEVDRLRTGEGVEIEIPGGKLECARLVALHRLDD